MSCSPCDVRKSKKNPNACDKIDLVNKVVKNGILTKTAALKLKKDELCKLLDKSSSGQGDIASTIQELLKTIDPNVDGAMKEIRFLLRQKYGEKKIKKIKNSLVEMVLKAYKKKQKELKKQISEDNHERNEELYPEYLRFFNRYASSEHKHQRIPKELALGVLPKKALDLFSILSDTEKQYFASTFEKFVPPTRSVIKVLKAYITLVVKEKQDKGCKAEECKDEKCEKERESFEQEQKEEKKRPAGDCIARSKLTPKPHQIRYVRSIMQNRGKIVVHGVGTGKTLTAVIASQCYLDTHPTGKVYVITPTSLQANMKKELVAYGADIQDKRYKFYTLSKFANTFPLKTTNFSAKFKNSLIIIDEAHNLRTEVKYSKRSNKLESSGVRVKVVSVACHYADKVIPLTATPIYNKPADMVNLVSFVDGRRLDAPTRKHYDKRGTHRDISEYKYFDTYVYKHNPKTKTYSKLYEFDNYFRDKVDFYSCDSREGYPTSKIHEVILPMTREFYAEYQKIENKQLAGTVFSQMNPRGLAVFFNGVRQASNKIEEKDGTNPKIEYAMNLLREGKKTVVFSHFKDSGINLIIKQLESEGFRYGLINGETSMANRDEIVKRYNSDKIKIIIITKAGGEGLDLKRTGYIILLEPGWNENDAIQVEGRGIRYLSHKGLFGADAHVDVFRLFVNKPPEVVGIDDIPSIDIMLKMKSEAKKLNEDNFLRLVKLVNM